MEFNELQPLRLIEEKDAKIYHARATFSLVSAGLRVQNPIPVYEEGALVEFGAADVYLDEKRQVMALLFFDYSSSTRLLVEIDEPVYATPVVKDGVIWRIVMSRTGTDDSGRVESLS